MYLQKLLYKVLLFSLIIIGAISCVKDVDLDQTDEISLQPKMQVDLLIFDVDEVDFIDPETTALRTVIKDTVRLEFLDDSYIQDDLDKVEFSFKYSNTFPQDFNTTIYLLSENDRTQRKIDLTVKGGSSTSPEITEIIDFVDTAEIDMIKRSIKMVVEVAVVPNTEPFVGELKFQSKGLFYFVF
ncbi:hypothetical protein [Gillisia sp. Hel1_33_143]|uniref:hypothetical protein n=1 Tax=Gillisia sp. Hel1_33_143 TaxID=1336796 RepID=UPI000B885D95|nr:hypothetical protein [Gillisia sp. Hel1_33_143]